ncbi:MAG: hypothetical protein C0592_10925 [Marinilabiliales bacterium]|nr:MAG: hypothetical protein C0592_10925 [Marinilabiliales bacterium]
MKNSIYILGVIVAVVVLSSCEGETRYNWYLDNQSSNPLNLGMLQSLTGDTIFGNIQSGERFLLEYSEDMGGSGTALSPLTEIPYMNVVNSLGDTLNKDYTDLNNWTYNIEKVKNTPAIWEQEYIFSVLDSDF